jgi:tripartite-type tricarboxylate transporter receptor subunit TctC
MDDLLQHEVTFAASGPAGVGSQFPRAMNALIGTHAKVIHGYEGTGNMQVAMQRGEVRASCTYMLSALTSTMKTYYESGQLVPFIQFSHKSDQLPNVPHILDYAKTDEDKEVFKLIFQRDIVGRAIVAPPQIPAQRVTELRAAFDAIVKDPIFLADAEKRGLPIDPLSGAQDDAFVKDLMAIPATAVARANAVLASGLDGTAAK